MNTESITFRKTIHQAIRESKLTFVQRVTLNAALLLPGKRRRLEEKILNEAKIQLIVPFTLSMDANSQLNIDWEKVKKFVIDYLPTIINLLILFLL